MKRCPIADLILIRIYVLEFNSGNGISGLREFYTNNMTPFALILEFFYMTTY